LHGDHEMQMDSRSYWQSTAPTTLLSTNLPRVMEVAIIGSGLLGTVTCYWLARQGISVALLERRALAAGATGRNGGFVVAGPTESYPKAITHLGHEAARATMEVTYESQAFGDSVWLDAGLSPDAAQTRR